MNIADWKEKFNELANKMAQAFGEPPKRIRIGDGRYEPEENGLRWTYDIEIEF